ncbi:unnamed protein product [Prunus armeniaca]|uniref:Uncharacterized protein n=1 Tax=Prunus armeniaca TaxID=36596 RepID=A0A6J5W2J3_PRUAR|nr:unnamed protein product [Prunus armeniaca]
MVYPKVKVRQQEDQDDRRAVIDFCFPGGVLGGPQRRCQGLDRWKELAVGGDRGVVSEKRRRGRGGLRQRDDGAELEGVRDPVGQSSLEQLEAVLEKTPPIRTCVPRLLRGRWTADHPAGPI